MTLQPVHLWWLGLCAVSLVNLAAWLHAAGVFARRHDRLPPELKVFRRWQLLLSVGYLSGCAFRSVLPVYDVPRIVLIDSPLATVLIGRSVATVAELCFAAQWMLLLRMLGQLTGDPLTQRAARVVLPAIALAEMFSWYSVLSTSNLGHVVEESLWGLCALLLVLGLARSWRWGDRGTRRLLLAGGVAAMAYAGYMFAVDVPMYGARWLADHAAGRDYLGLIDGLADSHRRRTVSARWDDWHTEMVWMSLYFSVGVWLSVALAHLPMPRAASSAQMPAATGSARPRPWRHRPTS